MAKNAGKKNGGGAGRTGKPRGETFLGKKIRGKSGKPTKSGKNDSKATGKTTGKPRRKPASKK